MQITYHSDTGFIIKGNNATVALDCKPEQIGGADIVVNPSENDKVKPSKEQAHFDWPGEYEAKGIAVAVIPVGKETPAKVAKIIVDEIAVLHLDRISEALTETDEAKIGNIDILMVGAGKDSGLSPKEVQNIIEALEPRLVIPMNYAAGEEIEFGKQVGLGEAEPEDSLRIKKVDLVGDRIDLKILKARK